jgi:hypothetical protein
MRESQYVLMARLNGASTARIIFFEMLPSASCIQPCSALSNGPARAWRTAARSSGGRPRIYASIA